MLVASHGVRAARNAPNLIPHSTAGTSRGIHIPTFMRPHPRIPHVGQAQKLFSQSRNLLAQFFSHLTAPGLHVPTTPPVTRSIQSAAHRTSIQQGFSLPVRTALARPLQPRFLPRAPAVPRTVAQVGLGTARNFSSGRPIFQNLVDNVPVVGRAFYEADWELKMRQEKENMRKLFRNKTPKVSSKEMLKPNPSDFLVKQNKPVSDKSSVEAQFDQYFAAPAIPDVTTCLFIPLAPTPTARVPLSEFSHTDPSLLPLPALASIHASYETHSLRVSSLFTRLDVANVWERGVQCSAFSHGGDHEGVCTMLKIEFIGWTKAEVRSVLGESGTGWCVLEETKTSTRLQETSEDDETLSDASSVLSSHGDMEQMNIGEEFDPSQSFILPTLDFSSSFLAPSSHRPSPSSVLSDPELLSFTPSESDFDPWLDSESSDSEVLDMGHQIDPPSMNGWFGFSSQFVRRAEANGLHEEGAL